MAISGLRPKAYIHVTTGFKAQYESCTRVRTLIVTNGSDRMSDLDGFEQRFTKDLANATLAMISDDTRRLRQ